MSIAAVVGSAAIALTGCATNSTDSSPTPGSTTSVTATVGAPTTAAGDGGTTAPEPTRADTGTAAPATTQSGSPTASPVDSPSTTWDPCSLPASDLAGAGLNTTTETPVSGSKYPSCKWQANDGTFELIIVASEDSMDEVLEPGTYQDLRRTEYYGRQLALFRSVQDTHKVGCHVATPAQFGSIVFTLRNTRVGTDVGDSCADIQRVSARLFNSLP